jgi:tetratricopeptide (TPR) repeat protein
MMAILDYWARRGGNEAKQAISLLAAHRETLPIIDRAAFLEHLAQTELRLGEPELARKFWRELAVIHDENIRIKMSLFDLAHDAGDRVEMTSLTDELHKLEGDGGTAWKFARATLLIDDVRLGGSPSQRALKNLEDAHSLATQIVESSPQLWYGPVLLAEIAELSGLNDKAVDLYIRAIELGNDQPAIALRLINLLSQGHYDREIASISEILRNRDPRPTHVSLLHVLDTFQEGRVDQGLVMARRLLTGSSQRHVP